MQKNSRTSIESILVIEQVFADLKFSWEQEMMRLALAAYVKGGPIPGRCGGVKPGQWRPAA
ncbi:hypothetical protein [Methylobacterium cerastii]|uniref:hypothetical protein n=1 Tax=Methylobacterium cerastii TaxID=932741 RepID=UPI001EE2540B|nr:hypothetical protein [Methylobacterium cerastii]